MVSFMIKEMNDKEKDKELWHYIEDKYKDIEEVEKYTYKGCRNHKDFSYTKIISRSEAMEDVIILFRAILYNLKDIERLEDIFKDIKTSILKELNNIESITNYDFEKIVFRYLEEYCNKYIGINGFTPLSLEKNYYYYSEEYEFLKDSRGYYTYLQGDKFYLKYINRYSLSDYIKKSINPKGEIVHYIGKNLKEKKDFINIEMLISGKEEKHISLKLSRAKVYDYLETLLDETTYKDILILTFKKLQELYRHKGKFKIKNTMFLLVDSYYEYMDMDILGEIKTSNNIVPVGTRGFGEGFFINTRGYALPNSNMLLTLYNHGDKQCKRDFKPELYVDSHMVIERLKELCYRI